MVKNLILPASAQAFCHAARRIISRHELPDAPLPHVLYLLPDYPKRREMNELCREAYSEPLAERLFGTRKLRR